MTPTPDEPLDTTDDAFLGGRLILRQLRRGYRAGLDAVLLAAAVPPEHDEATRILDAGCGVGTVGLCVAVRLPRARVVLLERDAALAELAAENVSRNGLGARVKALTGDILAKASDTMAGGLTPASFQHTLANPPYHATYAGTRSSEPRKDAAHAMPASDLDRWARFLARMAAPGGTATLIHRADALPALVTCMDGRFGGLTVLPVHPRAGEPASRVIVRGRKGSRAPLVLLPGLVLHDTANAFTPAAEAILRQGAGLDMP